MYVPAVPIGLESELRKAKSGCRLVKETRPTIKIGSKVSTLLLLLSSHCSYQRSARVTTACSQNKRLDSERAFQVEVRKHSCSSISAVRNVNTNKQLVFELRTQDVLAWSRLGKRALSLLVEFYRRGD